MVSTEKMLRVNKSRPCPVCGKPDWCLRAKDGSSAICARIAEGSKKQCGQAGWLHILSHKPFQGKRRLVFRTTIPKAVSNHTRFSELSKQYRNNLSVLRLEALAKTLNLTSQSLMRLGIGWDGQAYTFPMSDAKGRIIGIRRRFPDGSKYCVGGSKTGLFLPEGLSTQGLMLICEGPTDTAAALCLGLDAVGRPNCSSGNDLLRQLVTARPVVIVSDNDDAGRVGAKTLARQLLLYCPSVRILYPPTGHKDLRQWLRAELTTELLQNQIEQSPVIKVVIQHG